MKRIYLLCMLMLLCSLPGQAQFWISFGWNEPHCQSCLWMEQAMRLNGRQAADYHNIVHKYGQKIEKEARKHYRYWDQSAKKIFNLRMERDRKLQRVLSPSQGWYNNPNYPDYRPSHVCWRYEDHYWYNEWVYSNGRWNGRFDDGKWYPGKYDSPGHRNHRPDRYDRPSRPDHNQHYDRPSRPHNDRYSKDKKSDNRRDRDKGRDNKDRKEKDKKDKKENKRQESKRSEVYRRS